MDRDIVGLRSTVTSRRLHAPQPSGLVHRPRLVDELVAQHPVTLVTAPAGSGKTVLATDWATSAVARKQPVAWLSLEPDDDQPFQFWSAVLASLDRVVSASVRRDLGAFSPPMRGCEPRFIHAVCDALLDEPTAPWMVLDDIHRLTDPDVLAGLEVLLSRAGEAAQLILLGRTAPPLGLPRLRLEGKLGEVTATDLAFTVVEAQALLAHDTATVDASRVEELVAWTEGWAAGLRLAAISSEDAALRSMPGPRALADRALVSGYLFDEVLRNLPADVQEFLVGTCTPVQLSPELAAHLSGRRDAGELLERLCRLNVLVLRSGSRGTWYRYHSLLRGYLLDRLAGADAEGPARQHRRTAQWFASHGEPVSAMRHATWAHDEELVADLVRSFGLALVMSGHGTTVLDAVGLPREAATVDPYVAVVAAIAGLEVRDLATADEWLSLAAATPLPDDPRLRAMHAAVRVHRALLGQDVPAVLERTSLLELERTGEIDVDMLVDLHRGPARLRLGDVTGAMADLEVALALARRRGYDQIVLECLSQMSGMAGSLCDFPATARWSRQAISFATTRGWADSPRLAYAYLLASWTCFQTGDEDRQTHLAELGVRALDGVDSVEIEMGVRSMHALARFERGTGTERVLAAEAFHALWERPAADLVSPFLLACATAQELKTLILVGHLDAAAETVRRVERLQPGTAEAVTLRALLIASRGDGATALRVLAPAVEDTLPRIVPTTTVLAQVTAACIHLQRRAEARAIELVRQALQWAAPNGFQRPFIDAWRDVGPLFRDNAGRFGVAEPFVTGLVTRFRDAGDGARLVDVALSPREQEVLNDLPSGLTVVEIAELQRVSPNTVKTHLRNLYAKLGVASRGEAIRAARARGLL